MGSHSLTASSQWRSQFHQGLLERGERDRCEGRHDNHPGVLVESFHVRSAGHRDGDGHVHGPGRCLPTGTVDFYNGSTLLGTATLSTTGTATYSNWRLPIGSYSITATYVGNGNFTTSSSKLAHTGGHDDNHIDRCDLVGQHVGLRSERHVDRDGHSHLQGREPDERHRDVQGRLDHAGDGPAHQQRHAQLPSVSTFADSGQTRSRRFTAVTATT